MKLLICAATSMELPTLQHNIHHINFMVHGIGMTQTAFTLGTKLPGILPDLCIQIGIAGSYNPVFEIGEVVWVQEDVFADLGARDQFGHFLHRSDILPVDSSNPFESKILFADPTVIKPLGLAGVKSISVNTVQGDSEGIKEFNTLYHSDIETMEGAAFFASCKALNIPYLQLRSISNKVEPRNKELWNIPLALQNLHRQLFTYVDQLV